MVVEHEVHRPVEGPLFRLEVVIIAEPFEDDRRMFPGIGHPRHAGVFFRADPVLFMPWRTDAIAAEAGLDFKLDRETRVWNSFDGHRLVYWAELAGDPLLLKMALFKANFCEGRQISSHEVLAEIAVECGLDGERAKEILSTETYLDEVDERMKLWMSRGIRGVPAIIFNERHLVEGGQSASTFAKIMRQLAGLDPAPTSAAT